MQNTLACPSNVLRSLVDDLRANPAVQSKLRIREAWEPAVAASLGRCRLGDDCAALPDGAGGFLLFAAEGLTEEFVNADPWFAGYSAVMVNVSDVAAMGGRPIALTDVLWAPDSGLSKLIWSGMQAAAADYGVPIVGGHTGVSRNAARCYLATSIVGRATKLITSFDATPGDRILMAVDLAGSYRTSGPFWNASVGKRPERLQANIGLLAELAERDWCTSGKDISNGGVIGTLCMLLESSGVGARLQLERVPRPRGVDLYRWLVSFPSFGYLLSVAPERCPDIVRLFGEREIECADIGTVTGDDRLVLYWNGASCLFRQGRPREAADA